MMMDDCKQIHSSVIVCHPCLYHPQCCGFWVNNRYDGYTQLKKITEPINQRNVVITNSSFTAFLLSLLHPQLQVTTMVVTCIIHFLINAAKQCTKTDALVTHLAVLVDG
jgi:hypothetical protein